MHSAVWNTAVLWRLGLSPFPQPWKVVVEPSIAAAIVVAAIIAVFIGGLILLIALTVFAGWKLPYIQNDQQALLAIGILMCFKVANALTHYLFFRS